MQVVVGNAKWMCKLRRMFVVFCSKLHHRWSPDGFTKFGLTVGYVSGVQKSWVGNLLSSLSNSKRSSLSLRSGWLSLPFVIISIRLHPSWLNIQSWISSKGALGFIWISHHNKLLSWSQVTLFWISLFTVGLCTVIIKSHNRPSPLRSQSVLTLRPMRSQKTGRKPGKIMCIQFTGKASEHPLACASYVCELLDFLEPSVSPGLNIIICWFWHTPDHQIQILWIERRSSNNQSCQNWADGPWSSGVAGK